MEKKIKKGRYMSILFRRYLPMLLLLLLLVAIDSASYTYVAMFINYILAVLANNSLDKVNLPQFLIDFFNSGSTVLVMVTYAGIALFIFQMLRGFLKFIMGCYRQYFGETISKNIREQMYAHIQSLPYSYHNNVDTGDLIQRCTTDTEVVRNFMASQLGDLISVFAVLIMAVYQMSRINTLLTWVSLIIVPLSAASSIIYFIYVEKKYQKIEESESQLMTIMQENLAGVRVIKAFGNETFEKNRFEKQNQDYAKKNLQLNKTSSLFWGIGDFIVLMEYLLVSVIAVNLARKDGSVTQADIATMMLLISSFIWPIRGLGRTIGEIGKSFVASNRIYEVLSMEDEYKNDATNQPEISGKVVFNKVSFKFPDTDEHLLNELSFEVNAGETIAIIGKTGSGKSTIAKLLTRLHDYHEGSITIDGYELKDINKRYIRKNIGLILQEPFLFTRSVYDNIAITDEQVSSDLVYKAARISAIENDINSFEKGYQTLVGEKGTTLSGGQKQRIAIARMLIDRKPIIIFDDSLSAVDTETDLMIRNALSTQTEKPTMFIITHRITTAKQADKIIVLENGHVSQIGTHQTLANVPGLYKKLWDIQGEAEQEFLRILHEGGVE